MKVLVMIMENVINEIFIVFSKKEWYYWYFKGFVLLVMRRVNYDSIDYKLICILM